MEPLGLLWDRGRWYLAGRSVERERSGGVWRADRVVEIEPRQPNEPVQNDFDVRELLGRTWLQPAMETWWRMAPVRIRLSPAQAERLRRDWYYRHAHYEPTAEDQVVMSFGEQDSTIVFELLRWLGPGANRYARN